MGCRWTPPSDPDMKLFTAVEVINYGEIMFSSAKYWDSQLRAGHRLTAIGGSDNHNATVPPGDVAAILDGIRAGRTFIDLTGSRDKMLANAAGASAKMGGTLDAAAGATISVHIHTIAAKGSTVHLLLDGDESMPPLPVEGADSTLTTTFPTTPGRHWLRLEVHDSRGANELLSSPLYINFPQE